MASKSDPPLTAVGGGRALLTQPVREGDAALHALFARVSRQAEQVIVPINDSAFDRENHAPAIYCVHSLSGAGGSDFVQLARLLPDVRFFGVQAPPQKMRDAAFGGDVAAIADYYVSALVAFQPEGGFALGGWSAGAVIALEMAQQLKRIHGREVRLLVAFDAAPENVAAGLRPWHPLYLWELAANLPGWARDEGIFKRRFPGFLARSVALKLAAVGRRAMARARGEATADGHAVAGFMDIARFPADQLAFMRRLYDALLRYKPEAYAGSVVVYEATIKPPHRLPQVARIWRGIAAATEVASIAGATHLSLMREPHVQSLARDLGERIAGLAHPDIARLEL